jgi:hypothetical protein
MAAAARHRARHQARHQARSRKPRRANRDRGFRSGGTTAHSLLPYASAAGVAVLGASVIAATPVGPPPPPPSRGISVASAEVRLAAASSLLNVPINLLIDIINIPYNEVQALDYLSRSLVFSGPWFVVSATNIWGVDPGDPGHFMSTVNLLVPFPALSGLGLDQSDQNGLGQQLWHFVAAELPVNQYCDADGCPPGVPISPITGITGVDNVLWGLALTFGLYGFAPGALVKFPLFNNWFSVPLSDLVSGYTFGPDQPGYADPSGPVYPGFGFAGTTEIDGPNGPEYLMPWANTTFKLDLFKPFQNYFDHLMADPATNPIHFPDLVQIGRTLQTLAAAFVIAFDPLTPGAGLCTGGLGNCSWLPPALDYPGIVKFIGDLWPGNTVIDEWLDAVENGTANVPTQEQIDTAARLAQQNGTFWDFGNPSPPPALISGFNLSTLAPFFHQLWTALGFNPPPLAPNPAPATDPPQQQTLSGDATLDSIPQGSEDQQNGPNTGVQRNVDPKNVLSAAGEFDDLSRTVVLDVGKPTLTPTSLPNLASTADGLPAGPAEPPKADTEGTGKADNGTDSSGDTNTKTSTESTGKADNGTDSSGDNNTKTSTENGSPRHAKQNETGPRHAKVGSDNDSSGGAGQHRADAP